MTITLAYANQQKRAFTAYLQHLLTKQRNGIIAYNDVVIEQEIKEVELHLSSLSKAIDVLKSMPQNKSN